MPSPTKSHRGSERDGALTILSLAGWLWFAGFIIVAGWLAVGRRRLRAISRSLPRIHDGPLAIELANAMHSVDSHPDVSLRVGGPLAVPVTWGLTRPTILLPGTADTWPVSQLRIVLLHELAHIRRRDSFINDAALIVAAVFWFNPLAWLALRALRATAERAADDVVIASGVRPSTYVDALLELLKSARTTTPSLGVAALAMGRRGEFEGRMLALLDERVPRTTMSTRLAMTVAAAGAVFVAVAAGVRPVAASPRVELARANPVRDSRQEQQAREAGSGRAGAPPAPAAPARPLPPARAQDRRLRSEAAVRSLRATPDSGGIDVLLAIAERVEGDIERGDVLRRTAAQGRLTSTQTTRFLSVAAALREPIPLSVAVRELARATVLDSVGLATAIDVSTSIGSEIERSSVLATLAGSQQFSPAHRTQYLRAVAALSGVPMRAALDALR